MHPVSSEKKKEKEKEKEKKRITFQKSKYEL